MGTNYYWQEETCPTCGHSQKRYHIGKSSGGWTFSFHALDEYESPTNKPVRSVKDWKALMKRKGLILDEYGEITGEKEFWKMVTAKRKVPGAKSHATEAVKHGWYINSSDKTWLDKEGHSFSSGHFS